MKRSFLKLSYSLYLSVIISSFLNVQVHAQEPIIEKHHHPQESLIDASHHKIRTVRINPNTLSLGINYRIGRSK